MSAQRLSRWQKAGALIPMALLVGAWGAAMNNSVLADIGDTDSPGIPDVPSTALEQPATVESQTPAGIDPQAGSEGTLSKLKTNGIPAAAMSGYQRAEKLLHEAVPSCNLSWTVLAGIGRVESNHGRIDGNSLTDEGTAKPGVYGVALDGSEGIAKIADTDNGKLDNDSEYDRAVGPMQFLPETWDMVAVDANNDGKKDPQNITDAATAAGIYLCSGETDLSSDDGARDAVHRYNHSDSYVDLVLSIAAKYDDGEYTKTSNDQTAAMPVTQKSQDQSLSKADRRQAEQRQTAAEQKAHKKAADKRAEKKKQRQAQKRAEQERARQNQQNTEQNGESSQPNQSGSSDESSGGSSKNDSSSSKKPKSVSGKAQKGVEDTAGKTAGKVTKPVTDTTEFVECKVVRNLLGVIIKEAKC